MEIVSFRLRSIFVSIMCLQLIRVNRNMICITEIETVFEIFLAILCWSKRAFFKMSLCFSSFMQHGVFNFFHLLKLEHNTLLISACILFRLQHYHLLVMRCYKKKVKSLQITGVKYCCEQAGSSSICGSFFPTSIFLFHRVRKSRVNSYAWGTLSNTVAWVLSAGGHLCIS